MPPLAVPSSLVRTMPVDRRPPRENSLRLAQAVLAGGRVDHQQRLVRRARRAAWRSRGAPSPARPSGRPGCAGARRCRRSPRRRRARGPAATASKATAPGSEPSGPVTISHPARSAQPRSCSTAAARKVSAAPSTTFLPSSRGRCQASLPIVVVLPVPLTPTTRITVGSRAQVDAVRRPARAMSASSSASRSLSASPPSIPPASASARAARRPRAVVRAPTSAMISASSRRSQVSLVERRPRTAWPGSRRSSASRVFARFSRRRRKKPRRFARAPRRGGRGGGRAVAGDEDVGPVAGHRRCATIAECRSTSGRTGRGARPVLISGHGDEMAAVYDDLESRATCPRRPADLARRRPFLVGCDGAEPVCCRRLKRMPRRARDQTHVRRPGARAGAGVARALLQALEDAAAAPATPSSGSTPARGSARQEPLRG